MDKVLWKSYCDPLIKWRCYTHHNVKKNDDNSPTWKFLLKCISWAYQLRKNWNAKMATTEVSERYESEHLGKFIKSAESLLMIRVKHQPESTLSSTNHQWSVLKAEWIIRIMLGCSFGLVKPALTWKKKKEQGTTVIIGGCCFTFLFRQIESKIFLTNSNFSTICLWKKIQ